MRYVLKVPLGRPLRIGHVFPRHVGYAGAAAAELLPPEVLNGLTRHMDTALIQGPAQPTNQLVHRLASAAGTTAALTQ